MNVEELSLDNYKKMQGIFAGVTSENALQVASELRSLGLNETVSSLTPESSKRARG